MPVKNLRLESTDDSITAAWDHPDGNFAWFTLTISSNMSQNIPFPTKTTNLHYNFTSLKAAALYNVSVITYVEKDLNPSLEVSQLIYTSKCE